MASCWFCREPITEPEPAGQIAAARAATAFRAPAPRPVEPPAVSPVPSDAATVTAPIQTFAPAATTVGAVPAPVLAGPVGTRTRRVGARVRWGRVVGLGSVVGLLVTIGALVFESLWTAHLPPDADDVVLSPRDFDDIGFSISSPTGWQLQETKRRVTFLSGESARERSTRGMRVSATDIAFDRVGAQIAQLPDRLASYTELETYSESVDGRQAVVHVFVADDLRFEQWWIERDEATLRVDLWSRPAHEEAAALNRRIVESITVS